MLILHLSPYSHYERQTWKAKDVAVSVGEGLGPPVWKVVAFVAGGETPPLPSNKYRGANGMGPMSLRELLSGKVRTVEDAGPYGKYEKM